MTDSEMIHGLTVFLLLLISGDALPIDRKEPGEWFDYGPGTITCRSVSATRNPAQAGPDGKVVRQIVFRNTKHGESYWCGAGFRFTPPHESNILRFSAKASSEHPIELKVEGSSGRAGYFRFVAEEDWTDVQFAMRRPTHGEPPRDIAKVEFIFNNKQFKPDAVFRLSIANVETENREPTPFLHPNWMPATIPPVVEGYRIETCIHSAWCDGLSDFPGLDSGRGYRMAIDIVDRLIADYGNVGVTIGYLQGESGTKFAAFLRSKGAVVRAEGHNGPSFDALVKNGALAIDIRGRNLLEAGGDPAHAGDMTHPFVLECAREKILDSAKAGANAWRSVDYTWQSPGGPIWGYSNSAVKRWRENLTETDAGLEIVEGDTRRVARFWEYFESYHGYRMKPADVGIETWSEYSPPKADEKSSPVRSNNEALFALLVHYEWCKFINEAHRPAAEYGLLAQPTLNPEHHFNGTDLYWLLRLAFVRGWCTEWWGDAGIVLPVYYNGRYFDNLAKKNGKEIVHLGESGAAGNDFGRLPNYWDNQANYLITYAKSASVDAKAMHDQYWAASWDRMTDPEESRIYPMYTAFRSAWCGFLRCRNDRAAKPKTDVLVLTNRGVTRNVDPFDAGRFTQPYNLARNLVELNYLHDGAAFPIENACDLDDYRTVVYSACEPPSGFVERLGRWVAEAEDRTVITHSFVPTRYSAPCNSVRSDPFASLQEGGREKSLEFRRITAGTVRDGILKANHPAFRESLVDFEGRTVRFARPICEITTGRTLVFLGDVPLVSERRCGKGRIVYLHFFPGGDSHTARKLERAVMDGVFKYLGYKPTAVMPGHHRALVFERPGGGKVFISYNAAARTDMRFDDKTVTVFQAQDPEVRETARLYVGSPRKKCRITDMITEEVIEATSDAEGYLPVSLDGWNMRGLYVD